MTGARSSRIWGDAARRARHAGSLVPGGWPVAAAICSWTGALWARPLPAVVFVALPAVYVLVRRRVKTVVWCCVALGALTNVMAARALAGLDDIETGEFTGTVTLITDPEPTLDNGWRFEADSEVGHVLVEVAGPESEEVGVLLSGQSLTVSGVVEAFATPSAWTRSRHLAGQLDVSTTDAIGEASAPLRMANRYRTILDRGSDSLSAEHRSLLSGIVIGDDRTQPPEMTADFRASGLTHLLAVSGQNLVFVLVVAMPLLRRLRLWPRYLASVGVVVAFATVTRFEPSVVRAAGVAAIALFATTIGRPSDGARHLALAVCALVAADPLLVHALGFRLSIAASVGVLVLAPRLVAALPGPRWFREGLGITVGAQIAVAPVLIPTFGAMPLAALPANVVAAPLAGFTMVWGLAAGTIAGFLGGDFAAVIHLPTRVALGAIEAVAERSATLPLGRVDLRHIAVFGMASGLWYWRAWLRPAAVAIAAVTVISTAVVSPALGERRVGFDTTVWVDGQVAVVVAGTRTKPVDVLDELLRARVVSVGLIVTADGDGAVVDAIRERLPVGAVVGPSSADVDKVVTPRVGSRIRVGRLVVVVDDTDPHLRVRVAWR